MTLIALVLSLTVAAFGVMGIIAPLRLLTMIQWFGNLTGLVAAVAFRASLGLSLIFSAHTSHFPEVIRLLGIVTLSAGLILPFIGIERLRRIIAWISSRESILVRLWAALTFCFGLFLSYAVVT